MKNNLKNIVFVDTPYENIIMRDMFSSTISKGVYNWPNVDLLSLSSLHGNEFNTFLIPESANRNRKTIISTNFVAPQQYFLATATE